MEIEIEAYADYASNIGCKLSKHAPKIIKMIKNNGGSCPCKKNSEDNQICPCPDHIKEIQETGSCTCNLFVKE